MTINKKVGGRVIIEVASLSKEGITILESKYSDLGFIIKYNHVKKDDLAKTLDIVINESVTMICRKM